MIKVLKTLVLLAAVSVATLWMPHPVQAATLERLIIGGNYTLEDGETLNDDLLIVGGRVILEAGSELDGSILMVGGSLEVAGVINGDIVVAGGMLDITGTAVIYGDITSAGAYLQRDPDAVIEGDISTEQEGPFVITPTGVRMPQINTAIAPSFGFLGFILRVILWALLAMLVALFLPNHLNRTARTAIIQPLISAGLGLLTAIVLPLVLVIIALTILGIPITLIGVLALILAWAFGLIALGSELGQRIAGIFKAQWHPALAAGTGTFFLILVINGVEAAIPCLGLLPKIIIGVLGLGAVMLTRFGLQNYPSTTPEIVPTAPEMNDPL